MAKITRIKASDGPRKPDSSSEEKAIVRKRVSVKDKKSEKAQREARRKAEKEISAEPIKPVKTENKTADSTRVKNDKNAKLNKKVVQNDNSDELHREKKDGKKPFILFRPFVALWNYVRDSWHELRQVRWPNRKTTWKGVLAVIVYSALFMVIITLLDLFFSWLFGLMLNN